MQVALIHHQYKLKGGMETYFFNLIKGFIQQKDQVTAYVYKIDKKAPALCKVKHTNLSWLPRTCRKFWFGTRIGKTVINQDIKISLMRALDQDIMVCGGTHLGFLHYTKKKPTLLDRLEVEIEKRSYHSSKIILAHSTLVKNELLEMYGVSEDKIVMSFPPLDTDCYQIKYEDKILLKQKFQLDPTKKAILFPSTGHKRKGFDLLLSAMESLPKGRFELVVAGNRPNVAVENLKYVGFVNDMPALYRACDVTVLPSYYEPFGLVVVESLECNTPVVVSRNVGAAELISENEGLVLDHCSPSNLAEAICFVTEKNFQIESDFVNRHALALNDHINFIKEIKRKFIDNP